MANCLRRKHERQLCWLQASTAAKFFNFQELDRQRFSQMQASSLFSSMRTWGNTFRTTQLSSFLFLQMMQITEFLLELLTLSPFTTLTCLYQEEPRGIQD